MESNETILKRKSSVAYFQVAAQRETAASQAILPRSEINSQVCHLLIYTCFYTGKQINKQSRKKHTPVNGYISNALQTYCNVTILQIIYKLVK